MVVSRKLGRKYCTNRVLWCAKPLHYAVLHSCFLETILHNSIKVLSILSSYINIKYLNKVFICFDGERNGEPAVLVHHVALIGNHGRPIVRITLCRRRVWFVSYHCYCLEVSDSSKIINYCFFVV